MPNKVDYIVVHYSATYPDVDYTAADINKMHRARGFDEIGYNYFIRRNGVVEKGRDEMKIGAHTKGYNDRSIGVCWAGGIERSSGPNVGVDNRTPAQTDSLINTIKELLTRYPNAKVVGHRDLGPTQCPGFDVQRWWKGVISSDDNTLDKKMDTLINKFVLDLKTLIRKEYENEDV